MKKNVFGEFTYEEYLRLDIWRSRRAKAIRAAGYKCQVEGCKAMDLHLHCHHLSYERLGNELDSDLQVLCAKHHREYHRIH